MLFLRQYFFLRSQQLSSLQDILTVQRIHPDGQWFYFWQVVLSDGFIFDRWFIWWFYFGQVVLSGGFVFDRWFYLMVIFWQVEFVSEPENHSQPVEVRVSPGHRNLVQIFLKVRAPPGVWLCAVRTMNTMHSPLVCGCECVATMNTVHRLVVHGTLHSLSPGINSLSTKREPPRHQLKRKVLVALQCWHVYPHVWLPTLKKGEFTRIHEKIGDWVWRPILCLNVFLSRRPGADPGFWSGGPSRVLTQGALSPNFTQSRAFSLKLFENCMILKNKSWGAGPQGPPGSAGGGIVLLFARILQGCIPLILMVTGIINFQILQFFLHEDERPTSSNDLISGESLTGTVSLSAIGISFAVSKTFGQLDPLTWLGLGPSP